MTEEEHHLDLLPAPMGVEESQELAMEDELSDELISLGHGTAMLNKSPPAKSTSQLIK